MYRIVRAAGLAVAAVALTATATFAAPSKAEAPLTAVAAARDAGAPAGERDLAGNPAPPPAPVSAPVNVFSQLFQHTVAAIVGQPGESGPAPLVRTLGELVADFAAAPVTDREEDCLANAVYFEARSESIEGQLAVAEVVLNRAASGRYPSDICSVVTQKAQFSFVRRGRIPNADKASEAWRKAVAVAHIAKARLVDTLPHDVLWYHASYVSPSWGKRLTRTARIGLHIFYS